MTRSIALTRMHAPARVGRLLWGAMAILVLVLTALGLWTYLSLIFRGRPNDFLGIGEGLLNLLVILFVLAAATIIFWKAEGQWTGVFLALTLVCYWVTDNTLIDTLTKPENTPLAPILAPPILTMRAAALVFALLLLFTFPDGIFTPRWTRWVALAFAVLSAGYLLIPDLPTNTVYGATWRRTPELSFVVNSTPFVIGLYAQGYRYRHAPLEQRNQLKWTALGMVTMVLGVMAYYGVYVLIDPLLGDLSPPDRQVLAFTINLLRNLLQFTLAIVLPVICLMIAIFRHRLWSADPVINRVLVYTALTGIITLIYVISVTLVGAVFSTTSFLISIPITILILLIFNPLRDAIRSLVDRLMFGERGNPSAVIAQLGEQVQMSAATEAALPAISETLAKTLRVSYVAIALFNEQSIQDSATYGQMGGSRRLIRFPITYDGARIGEIIVGQDWGDRVLRDDERQLVENVARQTGIVAHAIQLNQALQESRQQIVTAREEERRRLRRDLHDGLGPTLAAHTLKVGKARTLITDQPQTAALILTDLESNLANSLAEIRRLVYDLRPPILDQLGFIGAIHEYIQLLEQGNHEGTMPAFRLTITDKTLPPLTAAVEVAAYRITTEAITNVVKHAHAAHCMVAVELEDALQITVLDDGVGRPPDLRSGVGLNAMKERAQEVGGLLLIDDAPFGGTRVTARLPLL